MLSKPESVYGAAGIMMALNQSRERWLTNPMPSKQMKDGKYSTITTCPKKHNPTTNDNTTNKKHWILNSQWNRWLTKLAGCLFPGRSSDEWRSIYKQNGDPSTTPTPHQPKKETNMHIYILFYRAKNASNQLWSQSPTIVTRISYRPKPERIWSRYHTTRYGVNRKL